jgi:hypothetical protein
MKTDEKQARESFEAAIIAILPQATVEWPDADDPFVAVVRVRIPSWVSS